MIKSKKYKKLEEENERLNNELDSKIEYNKFLLGELNKIKSKNNILEDDLKKSSKNSIDLQRQISSLLDTNKDLTNWIQKILNEVGIQEVHQKKTGVTIPIYKVERAVYNPDEIDPNNFHIRPGYLDRQEIIIPELRFVKMGGN